jgi:hypothetical protein
MNRRRFLASVLAMVVGPVSPALAAVEHRKGDYAVDVVILYGMFTLHLDGTVDEVVDRAAGRYDVTLRGEGERIAHRVDSHGVLRDGRWSPTRSRSWFRVVGREARTDLVYDHHARTAEYHYRGETFLVRRLRVADDVVSLPAEPVDDAVSAVLNYADGRWASEPDGSLLTRVVRRRRPTNEGPDDVDPLHRAEVVPLVLKIGPDPETHKPTALLDLSGFSSWAREDRPARIVFGADRRPELVRCSLVLGTSVIIHMGGLPRGPQAPGRSERHGTAAALLDRLRPS